MIESILTLLKLTKGNETEAIAIATGRYSLPKNGKELINKIRRYGFKK